MISKKCKLLSNVQITKSLFIVKLIAETYLIITCYAFNCFKTIFQQLTKFFGDVAKHCDVIAF